MNVLLSLSLPCGMGVCTCQVSSEKCGGCLRIVPQEQKVPTTPGPSAHGLNNLPSPFRFVPVSCQCGSGLLCLPRRQHWNNM